MPASTMPAAAALRGICSLSSFTTRGSNRIDRKSTRLNSSHLGISYAVFCLKKKKKEKRVNPVARGSRAADNTERGRGTRGGLIAMCGPLSFGLCCFFLFFFFFKTPPPPPSPPPPPPPPPTAP